MEPYRNVPKNIAVVVSLQVASLKDLQTFYSVQDLYCLLDIAVVDALNKQRHSRD